MAFHVACPITCRKICFCPLGFPRRLQSEKGKNDFLQDVARVEQFLNDPWLIKARENATIQVKVPKVVVSPPPPPQLPEAPALGVGGDEESAAASAQVKRGALQKQAAVASMVAEDFARRFESGDLADTSVKNSSGEEPGLSNTKVMCRLCFSGENEGSERARKMLSCSSCGKKYHRNCLKTWSQNRDLFHWSSWTCPSCRICEVNNEVGLRDALLRSWCWLCGEVHSSVDVKHVCDVCRRIGDPNKFMFCKRCDGAYHCYCQQPPHKNIGHGPYLCPKHTKCHSCGSAVPGNGQSVRWFLGYTCCDACGRLFVKGNYCPVCLKVYRDSESTPMVCCDFCQKWVHCPCDGISDAKYMQFQVDGNLQYVCPTCRGECPQIRNIEEAVQELWRRRDEIDRDVIVSLRAAAGLPTQEEIFDISPFSDDEESGPLSKNDHGRSLKFSLKGMGDKSPRKSKKYGKKSSNKKYGKKKDIHQTGHTDGSLSGGYNTSDYKNEELGFSSEPVAFSPAGGILNEAASSKCKYMEDVSGKNETKPSRTIKIRKPQGITNKEDISTSGSIPKTAQGPKLVIHLGGRSRNTISPARPEATSFKKGQDLTSLNVGTDGVYQMKQHEHTDEPDTTTKYRVQKGVKIDHQVKDLKVREKEGHFIKLKTADSEVSNISSKLSGGEFTDGYDSVSPKKSLSLLGERGNEDVASTRGGFEVSFSWRGKHSSVKSAEDGSANSNDLIDDGPSIPYVSPVSEKDRKPYLKFKIPKNTNNGEQNAPSNLSNGKQTTLPLHGKEDITYTRGQRSKRRRPVVGDEDVSQWTEDNTMKDFTDANWILQKLGKDAAGKRVEVHQPSGNSWHRGTVVEVFEGTSVVAIALDDGKSKNFELGKQGIRFVSQKQKR